MAQSEQGKTATHRKLTTIFAADVQGYSRLMEADEEGTLDTLKQYRDAMARLIAAHGGRVVNTWGDGLLADFPSVVEAVRAAVDVQNELAERNSVRSTGKRMLFRIGINLGDVIVEDDDIYGDGVNIAARLQTQAAPGGIVISNTVYDQVRNKVPVGFEFLGKLSVKNIEEGVPSYAIRVGESPSEADTTSASAAQFGRNPAPSAPRPSAFAARFQDVQSLQKLIGTLAVIGIGLVAINLFTGGGYFWARWPLFAFAVVVAFAAIRKGLFGDRNLATLAVVGLGLVAINLMSGSTEFWAKWPLLVLAVAAGIRWVRRSRADDPAR